MENEYYYRSEIEKIMNKFIEKETMTENDFGYLGDTLARRMSDAAFSVLQTSVELNEFLKSENVISE